MAKVKNPPSCSGQMKALLFALLLATVVVGVYALFRMPQIRESFDAVADRKVLLIHAAWCGHCRTLLEKGGVWEQLKQALPGVTFQEVDESTAGATVTRYGVDGFPDIRIIDAASGDSVARYTGPRDVASLKAFVMEGVAVVKTHVERYGRSQKIVGRLLRPPTTR